LAGKVPERPAADGRGAAVADSIEPLAGALANRYAIEALLGRGATASVYLAHDLRHGRRIALKVLHDVLGSAVGVERLQWEIRVVARLQRPNILPLFDSGSDGGRLWYATPRQRRRASGPGIRRAAPSKVRSRLGVVYSFLGRHADAVRTGRHAIELPPLSRDADSGPSLVSNLVRSFMLAGQPDSAVALLGPLLAISSWISRAELRVDPTWAPLRDQPRFRELTDTDAESP
jgi:hypothetical protein